jgi:hypothetical protein
VAGQARVQGGGRLMLRALLCRLGYHHADLLKRTSGIDRTTEPNACWIALRCERCERVVARAEYDLPRT